jgi:hypothetical protein
MLTTFGYSSQHETALKNYLSVLLLSERLDKKMNMASPADIKEIVLPNHSSDILASFKASYPADFFKICLQSVN